MKPSDYWRGAIAKYRTKDWSKKPSLFAESIIRFLPKNGSLLELGAGAGNDGEYFFQKGFDVMQLDLVDYRSSENKSGSFVAADMSSPLKLDKKYDVVYAHLSLHYFTKARTKALLRELYYSLNEGGILAFLVNSTQDPEFGDGDKIEDHYHNFYGIAKRYFDIKDAEYFTNDLFEPLLIDDNGTSYKDREDGMIHLVQFVGRKI